MKKLLSKARAGNDSAKGVKGKKPAKIVRPKMVRKINNVKGK